MNWSHFQTDIYSAFTDTWDSLLIEAVAGSGKTRTLEELARIMGERFASLRGVMVAFNKSIAQELQSRINRMAGTVPMSMTEKLRHASVAELEPRGGELFARVKPNVQAMTLHSAGWSAWRRAGGLDWEPRVDSLKTHKIMREVLSYEEVKRFGETTRKLVAAAKGIGLVPATMCKSGFLGSPDYSGLVDDTPAAWDSLIDHYGLDEDECRVDCARRVLARGIELARETCDFDDMLYMPVIAGVPFDRYDVVLVDECFVGDTPILLDGDGKTMTISEMYDTQYRGHVVSWKAEGGSAVRSRVLNVRRVPVGKPMVRVITRRRGFRDDGTRMNPATERVKYCNRIVVCTADHRFWTPRGWIVASDLQAGETLLHESVAPVDRHYQQKYKHSPKGREALRDKASTDRFGKSYVPSREEFMRIRRGNGTGPSSCEKLLLERLGEGWAWNYAVPTREKRGEGWPTCYKVDIANPQTKVAIELDGKSHQHRKVEDIKKQTWLEAHGWQVVRLTNQEVMEMTDDLIHERIFNSPVEGEVLLVEPWTNRHHSYVYDLTVEDTHCYFAHGVLVHNCQDVSAIQRTMVERMANGGRVIACGDRKQSIFGFRGAGTNSMDELKQHFQMKELPLSVTYRCPQDVVTHAQQWVPQLEWSDTADFGFVGHEGTDWAGQCEIALEGISKWKGIRDFQPGDTVLCRLTRPLVAAAFAMIRSRIACRVLGRDIGKGLTDIIKKAKLSESATTSALGDWMGAWAYKQRERFRSRQEFSKLGMLDDKLATIEVFCEELEARRGEEATVGELLRDIESLFVDNGTAGLVTLSTIHKFKGSEADRVFVLDAGETLPCKWARQGWELEQEGHLAYVAATRAKRELRYITTGDLR